MFPTHHSDTAYGCNQRFATVRDGCCLVAAGCPGGVRNFLVSGHPAANHHRYAADCRGDRRAERIVNRGTSRDISCHSDQAPSGWAGIAWSRAADEPKEGRLIEESWEAYSIQGTRVGYAHTTIAEVEEAGQQAAADAERPAHDGQAGRADGQAANHAHLLGHAVGRARPLRKQPDDGPGANGVAGASLGRHAGDRHARPPARRSRRRFPGPRRPAGSSPRSIRCGANH